MAVTVTSKRVHLTNSSSQFRSYVQYGLTGTYSTSGFVTPFGSVTGAPGSSPLASTNPLTFTWFSPTGYIYVSASAPRVGLAPSVVTTKIFSAPGTELANGTAVPDASVLCVIDMTHI